MTNTTQPRTIDAVHCQACGSTDPENVGYEALRRTEGYTRCCNERAVYPGRDAFNRPTRCESEGCYHN